jgi:hypothetical protein
VDADGVNVLDLETSTLELVNHPAQWSRSISTWEDVLVHEQTPDQVLVLPALAETSNLEEKDTVILEHVINLREETAKVTNANVLCHLKAGDLLVSTFWHRDITVVHAQDAALLLWNAGTTKASISPCSLVATKGDASDISTIVDRSVLGKGSPATSNVEHSLALLESNLLTHDTELVVLQLFERFFLVYVGDYTRGVDHARAQEPAVKVITTVVVISDLFLIYKTSEKSQLVWILTLRASVHNDLWHHARQKEPVVAPSQVELSPIMTILQNLQAITIEINVSLEIKLVESLHWDLGLARVLFLELCSLKGEVVLNWLPRELCLVILSRAHQSSDSPKGREDRNSSYKEEKHPCLEATSELAAQVPWDETEQRKEEFVREMNVAGTFSWQRSICNGWKLSIE